MSTGYLYLSPLATAPYGMESTLSAGKEPVQYTTNHVVLQAKLDPNHLVFQAKLDPSMIFAPINEKLVPAMSSRLLMLM